MNYNFRSIMKKNKQNIKTVSAMEFNGWDFAPGQEVSFVERGTKREYQGIIVDMKPKAADVLINNEGTASVAYSKLKAVTSSDSSITWQKTQRLFSKYVDMFSDKSNWPNRYTPPLRMPKLEDYELRYHFGYRQVLGLCSYKNRVISLSVPYMQIVPANLVEDTILHEIAHAMVGPEAGHGPIWKKMAEYVGCKPSATSEKSVSTYIDMRLRQENKTETLAQSKTFQSLRLWVKEIRGIIRDEMEVNRELVLEYDLMLSNSAIDAELDRLNQGVYVSKQYVAYLDRLEEYIDAVGRRANEGLKHHKKTLLQFIRVVRKKRELQRKLSKMLY